MNNSPRDAAIGTQSLSSHITTRFPWKSICGLYQRYILPEYQKPLLYTLLGILFLSLWRVIFKTTPIELFHWLDVEYFLQNEDGTPYGYVYFPLGTILLFIGVVTVFTKVTSRLQPRHSMTNRRAS